MAYVEVKAKTVELAVEAAMRELGVTDRSRLDIKVLQEPERGFLGFGGTDAIVRIEEKAGSGGRQRRSRGGRGGSGGGGGGRQDKPTDKPQAKSQGGQGGQGRGRSGGGGDQRRGGNQKGGGNGRSSESRSQGGRPQGAPKHDDRDPLSTATQEPLVKDFLAGLVSAFGLEGDVNTRIDDDVIVADVVGDQTEALVGPRGTVMEAVHELTKTVLQKSAQDSARVRIDIAGYAERRRQALTIYAGDLITQVLEDGGEIMLEPMSAADRKVIHDAVGARQGVRSYSEGEAPSRFVVIAATEPPARSEEE